MNNTQLSIVLQTILEKNGIKKELSEIQKIVDRDMIKIIPRLETACLENDLKFISNEITKSLNNAFGKEITLNTNDVFQSLNQELQQISATTTQISNDLKSATDQLAESLSGSKLNNGISNLANISSIFGNLLTFAQSAKAFKNLD